MEIRKNSDNSITVEGYVNAICRDSKQLHDSLKGNFVEQVMPKVWKRALNNAEDVRILFNHNEKRDLGGIKDGNLQLSEDAIGLKVKAVINDEEVRNQAEKGKLTGWSFGFSTNRDSWEKINDDLSRRYLQDINLYEVSLLDCTPAYNGTTAEVRSEEHETIELRFSDDKINGLQKIEEPNNENEEKEERNLDLEKEKFKLFIESL